MRKSLIIVLSFIVGLSACKASGTDSGDVIEDEKPASTQPMEEVNLDDSVSIPDFETVDVEKFFSFTCYGFGEDESSASMDVEFSRIEMLVPQVSGYLFVISNTVDIQAARAKAENVDTGSMEAISTQSYTVDGGVLIVKVFEGTTTIQAPAGSAEPITVAVEKTVSYEDISKVGNECLFDALESAVAEMDSADTILQGKAFATGISIEKSGDQFTYTANYEIYFL